MKKSVILVILLIIFMDISIAKTVDIKSTNIGALQPDQIQPLQQNLGVKRYVYSGNNLIASLENGETKYYHKDRLGSNRIITDSNGNKESEFLSLPFGQPVINDIGYGFTGKEYDESNLHYFGARYYDSNLGRFMSRDPVPDELPYAYVGNNPMNYVDPSGMEIVPAARVVGFFNGLLGRNDPTTWNPSWEVEYYSSSIDTSQFLRSRSIPFSPGFIAATIGQEGLFSRRTSGRLYLGDHVMDNFADMGADFFYEEYSQGYLSTNLPEAYTVLSCSFLCDGNVDFFVDDDTTWLNEKGASGKLGYFQSVTSSVQGVSSMLAYRYNYLKRNAGSWGLNFEELSQREINFATYLLYNAGFGIGGEIIKSRVQNGHINMEYDSSINGNAIWNALRVVNTAEYLNNDVFDDPLNNYIGEQMPEDSVF